MNQRLTFADITEAPQLVTSSATLCNGESIIYRMLQKEDALRLGDYFTGLSQDTRSRFGPHEFTYAMAQTLCDRIGQESTLRFIAVTDGDNGANAVIAYYLLDCGVSDGDRERYQRYGITLNPETDCKFAPSVADHYQNTGVGSVIMPKCMEIAQLLGFQRMILMGGVYITNTRAIHYYEKWGFHRVGNFQEGTPKESFDMIKSL